MRSSGISIPTLQAACRTGRLAAARRRIYFVLLGELVVPLLLPAAPPVLLAPALPEVVPLELWSLRHFSFSAPIRLSHLALPVPAAEAPVPAPMLVPLEVV